jgi:ATP-binding cassette subfamily F protein uup
LPTLGVLERFLSDYGGCLLIVSHDRYFMDRLVDHLFVFEGEGNITDFPGNYSDYRIWEKSRERNDTVIKGTQLSTEVKIEAPIISAEVKAKKKLSFKEQKELELLEKDMPELEVEKEAIAQKMIGHVPFEELQKLSARATEITKLLEDKELRWLELSE